MCKRPIEQQLEAMYQEYMQFDGYKLGISSDIGIHLKIPTYKRLKNYLELLTFKEVDTDYMIELAGHGELIACVGSVCYYTEPFIALDIMVQLAYILAEYINAYHYFFAKSSMPGTGIGNAPNNPLEQVAQQERIVNHSIMELYIYLDLYKYMTHRPSLRGNLYDFGFAIPRITAEKAKIYIKRLMDGDTVLGKVEYLLEYNDLVLCNITELAIKVTRYSGIEERKTTYTRIYVDKEKGEFLKSKDKRYQKLRKEYQLLKQIKEQPKY